MPRRQKLTDAVVRQAPARTVRYELTEDSGLALRLSPDGAKRWGWRYRGPDGRQRRLMLGDYPGMGLGEARAALAAAQEKLAKGLDPADGRPARETVADLAETYLERHGRKLRSAAEVLPHLPGPGESLHALLTGTFDFLLVLS